MPQAILNGKLIDLSEAVLPVSDKGYFFDFAVYSSLKVVRGKIFFPDYHAARLLESAKLIGLKHSFKKADVINWVKKLVTSDKLNDALIKIVLIGDPDDLGNEKLYIFPVGGLTFYPDKLYKHGAKVITYLGERRVPESKTTDLLMSFLAFREAKNQNAIDALLVDRDGNIREGTRTNFFAIKGDVLFTPPKNQVLEGVTKKIILQITKKYFKLREEVIPLKNLQDFDEFFISSTSMNVMPINQIGDLVTRNTFEKTLLIKKLFKEFYDAEVFSK